MQGLLEFALDRLLQDIGERFGCWLVDRAVAVRSARMAEYRS